jgi:hypothetical protein
MTIRYTSLEACSRRQTFNNDKALLHLGESKNTLNTTLKKMGRPFAKPLGNEKQKTERAFKLIKLVMAKTRSGENIFMQCDLEFDCFATKRFYQKFQAEFSPFS